MDNMQVYNAVRNVPQDAQKRIGGGKLNGFTNINPMWRIKVLTEQFGVCGFGWYYEIDEEWTESTGEEIAAFVKLNLYIKQGGEWSKPIVGIGGSKFMATEKGKPVCSDECYKMATTDALSVACKQLGFGADVYWNSDVTKYSTPTQSQPNTSPKVQPQEQAPQTTQYQTSKYAERIRPLVAEMERTGCAPEKVCAKYGVGHIAELNHEQLKDCLKLFESVPSGAYGGAA